MNKKQRFECRDLWLFNVIASCCFNRRLSLIVLHGLLFILIMQSIVSSGAAEPVKPRYQIHEIENPLDYDFNQQISLIEGNGETVILSDLVKGSDNKPIIMQFIFTSCSNVCPVMSTILRAVQTELADKAQLVSISIDPDFDDEDELQDYANEFNAQPHWRFFTGDLNDIIRLQKRLNIYQQNKMRHQPVTFFLLNQRLFRLDGLPSKEDTLAEFNKLVQATQSNLSGVELKY